MSEIQNFVYTSSEDPAEPSLYTGLGYWNRQIWNSPNRSLTGRNLKCFFLIFEKACPNLSLLQMAKLCWFGRFKQAIPNIDP